MKLPGGKLVQQSFCPSSVVKPNFPTSDSDTYTEAWCACLDPSLRGGNLGQMEGDT